MKRKPCSSRQALVLASWEKNRTAWLEGGFFELRSKAAWLQETIGDGGTLWIVVSRPSTKGRLYTLSFCLRHCQRHTYRKAGKFGRFAVIGDPERSKFYATADAKLLLLALRFHPERPINGPSVKQVSNSIRVPRCLSTSDIQLLDEYATRVDRWSVFVSYQQRGDKKIAADLSDALQRAGVSVFRDQESLRGGDKWWPTIIRAITRSRRLVLLMGRGTHKSAWVRKEIQHAFDSNVQVIPVLAGGSFEKWGTLGVELSKLHALNLEDGLESVVEGLML